MQEPTDTFKERTQWKIPSRIIPGAAYGILQGGGKGGN